MLELFADYNLFIPVLKQELNNFGFCLLDIADSTQSSWIIFEPETKNTKAKAYAQLKFESNPDSFTFMSAKNLSLEDRESVNQIILIMQVTVLKINQRESKNARNN